MPIILQHKKVMATNIIIAMMKINNPNMDINALPFRRFIAVFIKNNSSIRFYLQ